MEISRRLPLAVCAGLILNGFVLGPIWLLTPADTFSETAALPSFALSQRLSWGLLTILVLLVPAMLGPGRRGPLPRWVVPVLQLALVAQAATNFAMGFVAPWLAAEEPRLLDIPGGSFQFAMTAIWIGFIVATIAVAVTAWRAGHSRMGAGLMILGALAIPGVGPIGTGLLALGLGLVAARQARLSAQLPVAASAAGAPA